MIYYIRPAPTQGSQKKKRQKNIAMTWSNDKKVYYIILQSLNAECLKMYKIFDNIINFIKNSIETCRVELLKGRQSQAEVKLQECICKTWIDYGKGKWR